MKFFDPLPLPSLDAATLATLLTYLRGPDPFGNLQFFTSQYMGGQTACNFYPLTAGRPAWLRATLGDNTLVLIDGVSSNAQATDLMNGYAGIIQSGFNQPENFVFERWGNDILGTLQNFNLMRGGNMTIAGWSAGGAVAARLPTLVRAVKLPQPTFRVISFGAPRVGWEGLARRVLAEASCSRYMAFDDPIPNFPPRAGTFTWVPFAVGVRASLRFANFCHHAGGLNIDSAGTVTDATVPTAAAITPRVALDVYWSGLDADALSKHSLNHYSTLLAMQDTHRVAHRANQVTPVEVAEHTRSSEVARQQRNTFSAVRDLAAVQESQPVIIPRTRLARAIRQGRVFYVVLNDVPLMMTPTRRRAQGLARDLNAFLRRNQSTAYVDPEALTTQIHAFLQAASDASSGIKPLLSTNIP